MTLLVAVGVIVASLGSPTGWAQECGSPAGPGSPTGGPGATLDRPSTLGELTRRADVVLEADVVGWTTRRSATGLETDVTLSVRQVLRGALARREVVLTVRGGELGGVRMGYAETPSFRRGERILVFAQTRPDGRLRLLDDFIGVLRVEADCRVAAAGLSTGEVAARIFRATAGQLRPADDVVLLPDVRGAWSGIGVAPWPAALQPVVYTMNVDLRRPVNLTAEETLTAWSFGFQVWDQASPGISTQSGGVTIRGNLAAGDGFNDTIWTDAYASDSPVLASTFFVTQDGALREIDIAFNEKKTFTTTGGPGVDLATVAIHEAGHAIGLGHSQDPAALMYFRYHCRVHELQPDDLEGLNALYGGVPTFTPGPSPTPTVCQSPTPTATPSPSPTLTATVTRTPLPSTDTPVPSATPLPPSATPTLTASLTPTTTPTSTLTPTRSPTPSATASPSPTVTETPIPTATASPSPTPSSTATASPSPTATVTTTPTPLFTCSWRGGAACRPATRTPAVPSQQTRVL